MKAMEPSPLVLAPFGFPRRKPKASDRGFGFHGALIFELDTGPGGAPLRYRDAILGAFEAGADMVLVREPSNLPARLSALSLEAIQAGLKSGRVSLARLEDAYRQVQRLKARARAFPSASKVAGLDRQPMPLVAGGFE